MSRISSAILPTNTSLINRRYLSLEDEPFSALLSAARSLRDSAELCLLAAYCRALIFDGSHNEDYLSSLGFPRPATDDSLLNDFFGLLVHLSGINVVEERYMRRNIPLEYMKNTYRSVYIWVHSFYDTFA